MNWIKLTANSLPPEGIFVKCISPNGTEVFILS